MTEELIIEPSIALTLHDELFGDLPVYTVSQLSDITDIYNYRLDNEMTDDGANDDFAFIANPSILGLETTKDKKFVSLKDIADPPIIFKAYYQDVGHFFEPMDPADLGITAEIDHIRASWYTLPKIPGEMVVKVDAFLHAVDKKHHSEGILLLTYDMDYKDAENASDGWGMAVPEQSNTAQHCDYDKTSIIEELMGTSTKIVGTIHSHPHMAAYASATDHNDQAGFDGLHITFGWKGAGANMKKEYHAELVRGNSFYGIAPEDVMDLETRFQYEVSTDDVKTFVGPESVEKVYTFILDGEEYVVPVDQVQETFQVTVNDGTQLLIPTLEQVEFEIPFDEEEVIDYVGKVTKKAFHQQNGAKIIGTPTGTSNNPINDGNVGGQKKALAPVGQPRDSYNQDDHFPRKFPTEIITFPQLDNFPDPETNIIFARLNELETACPACLLDFDFTKTESMVRHQCLACGIYYLFGDETFEEVDKLRTLAGYMPFADVFSDEPVVIWDVTKKSWSQSPGDSKKALA